MTALRIPATERFATAVGVVVIGLSIGLAVFVSAIRRELGPPEVVPRGIALGALYATAGIIAVLGARRHRPALVTAAGVMCFAGAFLSIATIGFLIPAILLVAIGLRSSGGSGRRSGDRAALGAAVGGAVVILVIAAGVALLGLSETRCWVATGTAANPVYEIVPAADGIRPVGGPNGGFASGCDGGALTAQGVAAEAVLLASAILLAVGVPIRRQGPPRQPPQPA